MASTYALPVNPSTQAYSHGHSRSQYLSDQQPAWGSMNGHSHAGGGHRHHHSEVNGQLRSKEPSPYADDSHYSHDHSHDHSRSRDLSYTLKPFMSGGPRSRPRGNSDLGRPVSRKSATAGKLGFSPIQEAHAPPSSSWLELPEALTALLIPLPYLFASLAYPSIIAQGRRLPTTLDSASEKLLRAATSESSTEVLADGSPLLHACTMTSAALLLIGIIAKIRSTIDQPLDRRKSFGSSEQNGSAFDVLADLSSLRGIFNNILGVLLPFYSTMQLGGAKTSLVLLAAVAAGLGGLDQKPGKHSLLDTLKRTLRTRKATCSALLLWMSLDVLTSSTAHGTTLGHLALATSILAIPPPLPTTGWLLMTSLRTKDTATRASLPKPSSPLISTSEDTLLTLAAGTILTFVTVIYSVLSSSSPAITHRAILFSTLSAASATALIFLSLPAALRTRKKLGLALGILVVAAFGIYEHAHSWETWLALPIPCGIIYGAVSYDTGSVIVRPHSHGHSHSSHKHSHSHDHHLHGNHSKLSEFLIARCAPGSIAHSIMIEKDSRRIAYFAMLNLAFMLVQFFYGFVSGSLGLLTDSIHMLFDCAGLAVGLAAAVMSKWPPNPRFPYGYGKIDTLSGFANGVFLMLVSVEIIFDASERLFEGHELQRLNELLIVSILGFLVNIVGLTAFGHAHHGHGHSHDHGHGDHDHSHGHHHHDNENMQGIFLHILADALGSVAVVISTLLTKHYGWSGWDPIASCIIAILIFVSAIPLVKSSGMRLLLSLPADVEYGIRNTLQELSSLRGVVGYTVPKFWLEDEGAAHSEVHAKEHEHHAHSHSHDHSEHDHSHDAHCESSSHSHHSHEDHDHDHDHDHNHGPRQQKVLGVIHIIASRAANLEDVRERTIQFLKGRGMDVVVHVEPELEGRCWCGGGNKTN